MWSESTRLLTCGTRLKDNVAMGYVVFRSAKLKSRVSLVRALQHNTRDREPPNADPARARLNDLDRSTAAALARYDELLPKKVRKNAVHAVEFVVSLSPEDAKRLGKLDTRLYLTEAQAWIEKRMGGKKSTLLAAQHHDEATPHLHLLVMPLVDGKLNARELIGGSRNVMREWQTAIAKEVGARYGLARGIPREETKVQHRDTVQWAKELEAKEIAVETREKAVATREEAMEAKIIEVNTWLDKYRPRISAELAQEAEKTKPRSLKPRTRDGGLER
jgi:hypothetical protein